MSNKNYELNKVTKIETIKEMMQLAVKEAGDKIAFEYRNPKNKEEIIKVTYEEFENDTNYLGTALSTILDHNTHIAIIGDNSYDWLTVYLTVLKSNHVFVPIDKELTKQEIFNVLKSSDSEVIFYAEKYEKYIEECKKEVPNMKYYVQITLLWQSKQDIIMHIIVILCKKGALRPCQAFYHLKKLQILLPLPDLKFKYDDHGCGNTDIYFIMVVSYHSVTKKVL